MILNNLFRTHQFLKAKRPDLANKKFLWRDLDNEENYNKVKDRVPYGPNDIEYKYNNYGFRCDDFGPWQNYPYRILFSGCSMTEGIGLPLDDCWAKILHKKICEEYNIEMPFWTIASSGTGIDQMVRYLYNFKDLLRPQIIISYLPSKERRELWYETRWGVWVFEPEFTDKFGTHNIAKNFNTKIFIDENYVEYQTEKNLVMLEMMLNQIDCSFLFSSSMEDFQINWYTNSPRFIQKPHKPEQYDVARDHLHAGPKTNNIMADMAFDYFKPIIKEKLGLT